MNSFTLPEGWNLVWQGQVIGAHGVSIQVQLQKDNEIVWGSGPGMTEALNEAIAKIPDKRELLNE